METFSALLTFCTTWNSPVTDEFPSQRPVTRIFDVFFDLRLNKHLSKQSRGWWFETPSCSSWRHRNGFGAIYLFRKVIPVTLLSQWRQYADYWWSGACLRSPWRSPNTHRDNFFIFDFGSISLPYFSLFRGLRFNIKVPSYQQYMQSKTSPLYWTGSLAHDDVIKWKHFPRHWPFVRGIHRSPVNSPHKGQWRGALMFSLICVWINGCVNNREAGDLRRYCAHYDITVMPGLT